jgi:hypothetical protein
LKLILINSIDIDNNRRRQSRGGALDWFLNVSAAVPLTISPCRGVCCMRELRLHNGVGRSRLGRTQETLRALSRPGAKVLISLGIAGLLAGCSGEQGRVVVYPVNGKVTIAGEVPEGALIVLYPTEGDRGELRPSAKVRQDGSFSLTTYQANDGAPSGQYAVTIQWNKLIKKGQDHVAGPNVIAQEYTSRDSSPWKINVAARSNELELVNITR